MSKHSGKKKNASGFVDNLVGGVGMILHGVPIFGTNLEHEQNTIGKNQNL